MATKRTDRDQPDDDARRDKPAEGTPPEGTPPEGTQPESAPQAEGTTALSDEDVRRLRARLVRKYH